MREAGETDGSPVVKGTQPPLSPLRWAQPWLSPAPFLPPLATPRGVPRHPAGRQLFFGCPFLNPLSLTTHPREGTGTSPPHYCCWYPSQPQSVGHPRTSSDHNTLTKDTEDSTERWSEKRQIPLEIMQSRVSRE